MIDSNVEQLKNILLHANPILFLGAGFSYGSYNEAGHLPTGDKLKEEIFQKFIHGQVSSSDEPEICKYNLQDTCQCVYDYLEKKDELKAFILSRFKHAQPKDYHLLLSSYEWSRIYTVNVDDLVENICRKNSVDIVVQNSDHEKNVAQKLEYIKLHGCVNAPEDPIIFSQSEYTNLISTKNYKLDKLATDMLDRNVIFVGASMEERDIDHYISQYEKAGHLRKGKLIFIDPYPTVKLKTRIKRLDGILLEWTTEKFLRFVADLNYNPTEAERKKKRLNYSGLFLYQEIMTCYSSADTYESHLYEGYNCKWEDIFWEWTFESTYIKDLENIVNNLTYDTYSSYCIAIYGNRFAGKDCALKQIGAYLAKSGYEVIEYQGKSLNINTLKQYISSSNFTKFALLISNAGYYYRIIEKLLNTDFHEKKLLIVSTSRTFYHYKKKYYLDDNPYVDYEIKETIRRADAEIIYKKLNEKGCRGDLSLNPGEAIREILQKGSLINLFSDLTYGKGFKKRIRNATQDIFHASEQIQALYIELVIFDKADLAYYPSELLTQQYSIDFNIFVEAKGQHLSPDQKLIVDYIRIDENGITLKNRMLIDEIYKKTSKKLILSAIKGVLLSIASHVSEDDTTYWRIIFESLLKEEVLSTTFHIPDSEILNLYYSLKAEYENISYYWLQLGIAEQRSGDFAKALNHLKMAHKIRPHAYQIQHAIARNYLKHANAEKDNTISETLFSIGESIMLELINSKEHYKAKARNYSIHCYAYEKIKYLSNHPILVNKKACLELKRYIDIMAKEMDDLAPTLARDFLQLLKMSHLQSILSMKPGDPYFDTLTSSSIKKVDENSDVLIDSY